MAAVGASRSVPTPGPPLCGSSWAVGGRTPLVFMDEGAGSTPRYAPHICSQHPPHLRQPQADVLGAVCLPSADMAAVGASEPVPTPGPPLCGSSWAVGGRTPLVFTDEGAGSTPRYAPRIRSQHPPHPRQPQADVLGAVRLHSADMAAVGASESVPNPGPPLCGSSWAVGGRIPLVFTDEGAGFTPRYFPRIYSLK
ncbi:hypothetical protein FRB93_013503 [Tulasnella sp. JGI-2019a]|nr:hypothetical protein FRB93_013503 [Tulasnella sp. JGI-2019a]